MILIDLHITQTNPLKGHVIFNDAKSYNFKEIQKDDIVFYGKRKLKSGMQSSFYFRSVTRQELIYKYMKDFEKNT